MPFLFKVDRTRKGVALNSLTIQELYGVSTAQKSTDELYEYVGYLARCIRLRSLILSNVPFDILSHNGDVFWTPGQEIPAGYEFLADLKRIRYLMEASTILYGAAYVVIERTGLRIDQLKYVLPSTIKPIWESGDIVAFERKIKRRSGAEQTVRIPAEDMLWSFDISPLTEAGVPAPEIHSAIDSARVIFHINDFVSKYAQRGLIKGTILTVDTPEDTPIDPEERSRIKLAWQNVMNLFRNNAGETEIFSGQVKPVTIGEGLADLSNSNLSEEHQKSIASALGIPHSLVMSDAANYATANAEQVNAYEFTVLPRLRMVDQAIQKHILDRFGYKIVARPERLQVYRDVAIKRARDVSLLAGRPVLTVNEARQMIGLEPIEVPDYDALYETTVAEVIQEKKSAHQDMRATLARIEAKQWRRRVKKHGRDASFKADYLTSYEYDKIRERLVAGMPIEEVFSDYEYA